MKNRIRISIALVALCSAVGVVSPGTVDAATWTYKYTTPASSCPTSGAYPIAGTVWFADYDPAGYCYSNGAATTTSDPDLTNDTWNSGAPMAPGFNHAGQSYSASGSVTIWRGLSCSSTKVTITTAYTTSLNYYSFKKGSSGNGC